MQYTTAIQSNWTDGFAGLTKQSTILQVFWHLMNFSVVLSLCK